MAEWTIAAVLKTVEHRKVLRGFESHSLRQRTTYHTSYIIYAPSIDVKDWSGPMVSPSGGGPVKLNSWERSPKERACCTSRCTAKPSGLSSAAMPLEREVRPTTYHSDRSGERRLPSLRSVASSPRRMVRTALARIPCSVLAAHEHFPAGHRSRSDLGNCKLASGDLLTSQLLGTRNQSAFDASWVQRVPG